MEQSLYLFLIMARWFLPRGKLTRNQLSQLLFVYLGIGSDIVDFFVLFEEPKLRRDFTLSITILFVWTLSMSQFCITLTSYKMTSRKRRAIGVVEDSETKETKPVPSDAKRKCYNICLYLIKTEIWSLIVSIIFMDGPFLIVRLYAVVVYEIYGLGIIFFICKNILMILFLFYRIIILYHNAVSTDDSSSIENDKNNSNFDIEHETENNHKSIRNKPFCSCKCTCGIEKEINVTFEDEKNSKGEAHMSETSKSYQLADTVVETESPIQLEIDTNSELEIDINYSESEEQITSIIKSSDELCNAYKITEKNENKYRRQSDDQPVPIYENVELLANKADKSQSNETEQSKNELSSPHDAAERFGNLSLKFPETSLPSSMSRQNSNQKLDLTEADEQITRANIHEANFKPNDLIHEDQSEDSSYSDQSEEKETKTSDNLPPTNDIQSEFNPETTYQHEDTRVPSVSNDEDQSQREDEISSDDNYEEYSTDSCESDDHAYDDNFGTPENIYAIDGQTNDNAHGHESLA